MAKKFYAVVRGNIPGIYETWEEAKRQKDGFVDPFYRGFERLEDARSFLRTHKTQGRDDPAQKAMQAEQVAAVEKLPPLGPPMRKRKTQKPDAFVFVPGRAADPVRGKGQEVRSRDAEPVEPEKEDGSLFPDEGELVAVFRSLPMVSRFAALSYARYLKAVAEGKKK